MGNGKRDSLCRWSLSAALGFGLAFASPLPAALQLQDFEGEANTFGQRGASSVKALGYGITFRLDNIDILTERTLNGLSTYFVPTALKLSSITVYDFEAALSQETLKTTLATLSGETLSVHATAIERGKKDSASFVAADGTLLYGTPVTFTFPSEPVLDTGATYTLSFDFAKADTPTLLGFANAATTAAGTREDFRFTGGVASKYAPHMTFKGTVFAKRFELKVGENEEKRLSELLAEDLGGESFSESYDVQDTVVAVNLHPGAKLTLDQPIAKASFVGTSFALSQPLLSPEGEAALPILSFQKGVPMTGPFTLRDGTTQSADGDASAGTPMTTRIGLDGDTSDWVPERFMLHADLHAACAIPMQEDSWFQTHPLIIASGRRLVLEAQGEEPGDSLLPTLRFEAADSSLVLARPDPDNQSGDIPERFREALRSHSGALYLARNATLGADTQGNSGALTVGQNGLTHTLVLMAEGKTLSMGTGVPLVLGDGADASGTFRQCAGTVHLNNVTLAQNGAVLGQFLQDAGTATISDVSFPATGEIACFRVGDGIGEPETATVTADRLASGTGSGTVNVEVLPDGRLEAEKIAFSAIARHTMRLRGGTLAAPKGTHATVEAGAEGVRVAGSGTLDGNGGSLTLTAITGTGDLIAKGNVTLENVRDYTGTIAHAQDDKGQLTISSITGSTGTVTLGHLGYSNDAAALEAIMRAAANYHGTLAFSAANKTYDFSNLRDVTTFPYALAFSSGQSITMRLDQYADASIQWPENPQEITLTLIEAGAYGGVAEIPHVPEGISVKFLFKRYVGDGSAELKDVGDYTRTPNENGVTDSLTWENPLFTGKGAWIDCEFNGTSANTGWFTLMGRLSTETEPSLYNGLLLGNGTNYGSDPYKSQVLLDSNARAEDADWFLDASNPMGRQGAVKLSARPYVALPSLLYPEAWSVALRFTTPSAAKKCLLAIGANVMSAADKAHNNLKDFPEANLNTLLLATGDDGNDLRLYYVTGNAGTSAATQVAQANLANATVGAYVLSVVCDGKRMVVYLDGAYLAEYAPEGGIRLGPGLQVGAMLGGDSLVQKGLWSMFTPVEKGDGGAIEYLRFYKGALTDTAMEAIAKETPHIVRNVRFVRDVNANGLWVDSEAKPWTKQTYNGATWKDVGTYAEPDEGTEVRLRVAGGGEYLLQANVQLDRTHCFHSSHRAYATLIVEPQEGATTAGSVRIVPYGVTSADYETAGTAWTVNNEWYTEKNADGSFAYGSLRFTGGAGNPICDDDTIPDFYGAGYLLPKGEIGVTGHFDAGVCRFSELAQLFLKAKGDHQPNALSLVAGLSLTRGVEDEAKTWRLSGPIVVEGTPQGDAVAGNPKAEATQSSEDVWVPAANDAATWTFFDRTQTKAKNANGAEYGLYAQGIQTPGRLYLDLTHEETAARHKETQAFSKQAWYRYGYPTAAEGATLSGMKPTPVSPSDFTQAVAFQIKLGDDTSLTLDAVPEATVRTLDVEPSDPLADAPTLTLSSSEGKRLGITKSVVASVRINVANANGEEDTLNLAEGVEIHRGGTTKGAYIVGNQIFSWPLNASSVPSLEVAEGGTLTFSADQNLLGYQMALVAHPGATIALADTAALHAKTLTLAEGATFLFTKAGVTFQGAIRLNGAATLECADAEGSLTATGGLVGAGSVPTLTVSAPESAAWSLNGALSGLALTKQGAGMVDFPSAASPVVEGMVRVEDGTLKVGTSQILTMDTHDTPTIGHYGLYVAKNATLARTEAAAADGAIACIPERQTLSGAGTIEGLLRLNRGAIYDGTNGFGLTANGVVTGISGEADIVVRLPETYAEDTPFLTALREERTVRRRLLSTVGSATWNTKGVIDRTDPANPQTTYSATRPGLPLPAYDEGTAWGGTEGNTAYDPTVAKALIASQRHANVASISSSKGYTKAGTYGLNATEISNAYRCFNGVWAFAPDGNGTDTREVLDSSALCMAYEFGISRLTILALENLQEPEPEDIRHDEQRRPLYVVVEASLRQNLKDCFGFAGESDAATQIAAFAPGVTLELRKDNGKRLDTIELEAFGGKPLKSPSSGTNTRWFAIPYSETNFPMGTIYMTTHAIAPEDSE